ncbi:hypothetical protein [Absidia glauca]|uniref:Protein kinase domain-containing protein n=1 Tax=Absidia glauca TaxID=4829 RepID=A0A163JFA0_ABSGL|nr:hypothetical protein [Absidia glauca]
MTIEPPTMASPAPQRRRFVPSSNVSSTMKMSPILSPGNRKRKEIGEYWLGKTLGKGSSGRVKLGVHKVTGQKVAVKIISKSHLKSNASVEKSIKREIAVMKLIKHPNIINLIDVIDLSDATNLYLILEFVEGGELFEHLISCGKLDEKEARKYFQQIIFALDYCHRHLICHRDLKPENLLLDKEKNIKICDFGMASLQPYGSLLETSCGSPHYASPEIVNGVPYNGASSDIWSCGVILFALLNGHLPFDDDNMHILLKKVKEGKYSIPQDIPSSARDLIERILVIDPTKRLTMTEVQAHPWFTVDTPSMPLTIPDPPTAEEIGRRLANESEMDERILATLQDLWTDLNSAQVVEALLNDEYNMQKVTYVLLQRYSSDYWQKVHEDDIRAASSPAKRRRPATICAVVPSGKEAFSGLNEMMLKLAEHENTTTITSPPPGIQHNSDPSTPSVNNSNNGNTSILKPVWNEKDVDPISSMHDSPPPLPPKPKIVRADLHFTSPNPSHNYDPSPWLASYQSLQQQQQEQSSYYIPPTSLHQSAPFNKLDQHQRPTSISKQPGIGGHLYNPYAYQVSSPMQQPSSLQQQEHQRHSHLPMPSPHLTHTPSNPRMPYYQAPPSPMSTCGSQSSHYSYMDGSYQYLPDLSSSSSRSNHYHNNNNYPPPQIHSQRQHQTINRHSTTGYQRKPESSRLKGLMHHLWRSSTPRNVDSASPSFSNKISPYPRQTIASPMSSRPSLFHHQQYHYPHSYQQPSSSSALFYPPSATSPSPFESSNAPDRSWLPGLFYYKEPKVRSYRYKI